MSDLAIYRAPAFRVGALVDVTVQMVVLTVRVVSGEADLQTGHWSYYVALHTSVDENDESADVYRRSDGDHISSFYVGEGRAITPAMLRPHTRTLAIDHEVGA